MAIQTKNAKYLAKINGTEYVIHFLTNTDQVEVTGESGKKLTLKLSQLEDLINTKVSAGSVELFIAQHNSDNTAHTDIRNEVSTVGARATTALNATNTLQQSIDELNNILDNHDSRISDTEAHLTDKNNPHNVTKSQIGLSNVTNDAQVKRSEMGVANGVATLNSQGKVPASQLPSYVDDVIELPWGTSDPSLPEEGFSYYNSSSKKIRSYTVSGWEEKYPESGKIYVNPDNNKIYRWAGTSTGLVEISSSLALGETSSTAFPGNRGKNLEDQMSIVQTKLNGYDQLGTPALQSHTNNTNNPHNVTKAQIGLSNVDNVKQIPYAQRGAAGGVATLDNEKNVIEPALLARGYVNSPGNAIRDKFVTIENNLASKQSKITFTSNANAVPQNDGDIVIIYA